MITKEILLQPNAAAAVIEMFEEHDLPLNITKGANYKTNDTQGTILSKLTFEYNPEDEHLIDWLIEKVEE